MIYKCKFYQISSGVDGAECKASCANATVEGVRIADPTNCLQYYVCSDVNQDGILDLSDEPLECDSG